MKISVYGSGYVGLVAAACFASVGHEVVCMDIDKAKIEALKAGKIPFYEPGLEALVQSACEALKLRFTQDIEEAAKHGQCQFIAVGTPALEDGRADLSQVTSVANALGDHIQDYTIIINKSTSPIGTADRIKHNVLEKLRLRECAFSVDVASNPEFLKQGAAITDFLKPDRILLGVDSPLAEKTLRSLYAPFKQDEKIMVMDIRSAELTKYASNAMLATRISFMNEMANLAEKIEADIAKVRLGMGADKRIGYHFTQPGCGYGGSCFGKDIQSLIHTAQDHKVNHTLIEAVEKVNSHQKYRLVDKINAHFSHDLKGRTLAVWGLSFKPGTGDMRDAPSIAVVEALCEAGALVRVYDPKAIEEASMRFKDKTITYCNSAMEAVQGAAALVLLTEWEEFKGCDFQALSRSLSEPVIFDGRNLFDPVQVENAGIAYYGIGRGRTEISDPSPLAFSGKTLEEVV